MRASVINIIILILIITSCRIKNNQNNTQITDNKFDSIFKETKIISDDLLKSFCYYSDSIIKKALNQKDIYYKIRIDSIIENPYYLNYFGSDNLKKNIRYNFLLKSPYSQYSFTLYKFDYQSIKEADSILDRVTTIYCISPIGLNKQPTYLFRVNNSVFWLNTPHSLSGKSFNDLKISLLDLILKNKFIIDPYERHYKGFKLDSITIPDLLGKWHLVYYSNIFIIDDSISKNKYDNYVINIRQGKIEIDSTFFNVNGIGIIKLQDSKAFLQNHEMINEPPQKLNYRLNNIENDLIWYKIYFNMENSLTDRKYNNIIFKSLQLNKLIKIKEKLYLIIDNDLYELKKN